MSEFLSANWIYIVGTVAVLVVLWMLLARRGRDSAPPVQGVERPASLLGDDGEPVVRVRVETATPTLKDAPFPAAVAPSAPPPPGTLVSQAPETAALNTAPVDGTADNLRLLKGVGPKLAALLVGLGVTRFEQIAAWTEEDVARVDGQLGNFKGRIMRDNWIDQAGYLARRDKAGFEAKYGALEGDF